MQLLEHRVVDAAVPVQNVAVQVPSHGAVDLEVRTHDTPPFALPRAPNMTARRKCDPDAWTGVLVQPLRAVAEGSVGASPAVDPLCTSLTVLTLDGVCRLHKANGCAAFVARCVVAAATPQLARGEVARLHNRWLAVSARERAVAESWRVSRERLVAESRRRARAGEAGPGRAAKLAPLAVTPSLSPARRRPRLSCGG